MSSFAMAQDPVPEGEDQSAAPLSTPSPAAGGVIQPEPATGPPEPAPQPAAPKAPLPPAHDPGDTVTLYAVPPMGTMTVPPLEDGDDSEPVVITRYGTQVDGATADRAHEAAALAGFTLREE
jgi:hypothetical protein